ncbi:hypothetical protein [Anaeromyxobacter paludicola]|uniref:Uncharacterized protein n=1 Tax=Anaeromyxobacter paludicola TaxID=2918171 RepID=A0ABM7XA62_9BACT|nr:hypothetical protein [Anaeromyxobacter paludicola]BDG08742.1 hypothetical protein AMPC_18550 [Anaeromyxobacter paludicola]
MGRAALAALALAVCAGSVRAAGEGGVEDGRGAATDPAGPPSLLDPVDWCRRDSAGRTFTQLRVRAESIVRRGLDEAVDAWPADDLTDLAFDWLGPFARDLVRPDDRGRFETALAASWFRLRREGPLEDFVRFGPDAFPGCAAPEAEPAEAPARLAATAARVALAEQRLRELLAQESPAQLVARLRGVCDEVRAGRERAARDARAAQSAWEALHDRGALAAPLQLTALQSVRARLAALDAVPFCQKNGLKGLAAEAALLDGRPPALAARADAFQEARARDVTRALALAAFDADEARRLLLLLPAAASGPGAGDDVSEVQRLGTELLQEWDGRGRQHLARLCDGAERTERSLVTARLQALGTKLAASEPFVTYVEERTLGEERYAGAERVFGEVKAAVRALAEREILPRLRLSPEEARGVLEGISSLQLLRARPLFASDFALDPGFPLPLRTRASRQESRPEEDPFADAALPGLRALDAHFRPAAHGEPAGVYLQPILLLARGDEVEELRTVLAHEVGHQLAPRTGRGPGPDLGPAFEPLLECQRQRIPIASDERAAEVLADWIASRLAAARVAAAPPAARARQVDAALALECRLLDAEGPFLATGFIGPLVDDEHPSQLARINELFGQDPLLRGAMGLAPAPYCTLGGPGSAEESLRAARAAGFTGPGPLTAAP